jgi:prepilin-type N-terminal cleavage/methylation domain-containing protein
MNLRDKQGFTLIELLVVIAIIGILSSVVLASLNTARDKGADAAAKANLNNARAQAELYYDGSANGYDGVCTAANNGSIAGLVEASLDAAGDSGVITARCFDSSGAWAAFVDLKDDTSGQTHYCVDSSGFAGTRGNTTATTTCPAS